MSLGAAERPAMRAAGARAACSQSEEDGNAQESDPYEDREEECFTQGPVYIDRPLGKVARDDVHGMRVGQSSSCTVPPLPTRPCGRRRAPGLTSMCVRRAALGLHRKLRSTPDEQQGRVVRECICAPRTPAPHDVVGAGAAHVKSQQKSRQALEKGRDAEQKA